MFFRFWFLFACKAGLIGFVTLFACKAFSPRQELVFIERLTLLSTVALCLTGAGIGIWLTLVSSKMRCPNCSQIGEFCTVKRSRPAINCVHCGLVVAKSIAFSFKLDVILPHDI